MAWSRFPGTHAAHTCGSADAVRSLRCTRRTTRPRRRRRRPSRRAAATMVRVGLYLNVRLDLDDGVLHLPLDDALFASCEFQVRQGRVEELNLTRKSRQEAQIRAALHEATRGHLHEQPLLGLVTIVECHPHIGRCRHGCKFGAPHRSKVVGQLDVACATPKVFGLIRVCCSGCNGSKPAYAIRQIRHRDRERMGLPGLCGAAAKAAERVVDRRESRGGVQPQSDYMLHQQSTPPRLQAVDEECQWLARSAIIRHAWLKDIHPAAAGVRPLLRARARLSVKHVLEALALVLVAVRFELGDDCRNALAHTLPDRSLVRHVEVLGEAQRRIHRPSRLQTERAEALDLDLRLPLLAQKGGHQLGQPHPEPIGPYLEVEGRLIFR
mmetsp:Transcript_68743/g.136205  ORF Transcript_68743/g.136205 Transcript_68743/m.136205 type:complete len:381 (-) Transcript_68743:1556-2698(-)